MPPIARPDSACDVSRRPVQTETARGSSLRVRPVRNDCQPGRSIQRRRSQPQSKSQQQQQSGRGYDDQLTGNTPKRRLRQASRPVRKLGVSAINDIGECHLREAPRQKQRSILCRFASIPTSTAWARGGHQPLCTDVCNPCPRDSTPPPQSRGL